MSLLLVVTARVIVAAVDEIAMLLEEANSRTLVDGELSFELVEIVVTEGP